MATPNLNQLYTLLDSFYTYEQLCILCLDNKPFTPAYNRLESPDKTALIHSLIDHIQAIDHLQELLQIAQAHNPTLYNQHEATWQTMVQPAPAPEDYPTINRQEIMDHFRQLLSPYPTIRLLCLIGEAKMGKSHLMNKVFPRLARSIPFALVELGPRIDCAGTLQTIVAQLGPDKFPAFNQAYLDYLNQPVSQAETLADVAAQLSSRASQAATPDRLDQYLAIQFAADLRQLAPQPYILLFDTLDQAPDTLRTWLMNTVLVQLAALSHIRIVIAGRDVPPPPAPFTDPHQAHHLTPIQDEQEYIAYCRRIQAQVEDHSIPILARASQYKPGFFAELVFNYTSHGGRR